LSTTDADSRIISHTYDDLGRHLITTYGASGPYTQSEYDCCSLQWTQDENGDKTYYTYDDAGRVETMRTDIQSQGQALVAYTYDDVGNV